MAPDPVIPEPTNPFEAQDALEAMERRVLGPPDGSRPANHVALDDVVAEAPAPQEPPD
jgi:hypothetical protein